MYQLAVFLVAALSLAFPPLAAAGAASETGAAPWTEVGNGAVTVYCSAEPATVAAARQLVDAIEARRQLLAALVGRPLPAITPIAIYLFPDAAAGQPFGAAVDGARRLRIENAVVFLAVEPLEPQRPSLVRGAVHGMIEDHLGLLPIFWQAGFEQFLLASEVSPAAIKILAEAELMKMLRGQGWYSLSQFSEVDLSNHPAEVQTRLAAQVWALIYHDAVALPKKKERLARFVQRALLGESPVLAFPAAYGSYYDAIQLEVLDAVKKKGAKSFENAAGAFPLALPRVEETELAGADLDSRLGLLLADLKKPAPAEARCAAALEARSGHAKARLCAARLLELQGELEQARKLYAMAAAAAPEDGEIAYFAGLALLRPSPDDPAAQPAAALALLRKARELQPALGAAWADAAIAAYHAKPRPADAIALAEASHQRIPRRTDASLALFRLYREAGREADAEKLAAGDPVLRRNLPSSPDDPTGLIHAYPDAASPLDSFEEATRLMEQGRYQEALVQFQNLRRQSDNPSVAEPLDAKIAELRRTIGHNHYVAQYAVAAEHFNHQRWNDAIAVLAALLPDLTEAAAKAKTADLLAKSREMKASFERSAIHNRFVAVLNEATALYHAGRYQTAADLVERQLAVVTEPDDLRIARQFIEQCRIRLQAGRR